MPDLVTPVEIAIPHGGMLQIRDDETLALRVLEGTLWITRDRDIEDLVLERGASLGVERGRGALVSAIKSARVQLSPARPVEQCARGADGLSPHGRQIEPS